MKDAAESLKASSADDLITAIHCNVASPADCARAKSAVTAAFPGSPVSFLFNNAGISGRGGSVLEGDVALWQMTFNVNGTDRPPPPPPPPPPTHPTPLPL